MDVNTRNRADLKAFFVKNSIPTQSNFADLIDGMLNQKDDGFVKAKNLPLSIEAADPGVADSEKKSVTIYQSFADPNPAWTLSLNPRTVPNDPKTAKLGFSISDGEGINRLFIDRNSGHVGIGTITPGAKLEINATTSTHGGWLEAIRFTRPEHSAITHPGGGLLFGMHGDRKFYFTDIKDGFKKHVLAIDAGSGNVGIGTTEPKAKLQVVNGAIMPHAGNTENAGIMFPKDPFGGGGDAAWVRYHNDRGGEKGTLEIGIANDTDDHIALMSSGNVGIGTLNPTAKLHVIGPMMEQLEIIATGQRGDWNATNHPIKVYFHNKLSGKPKGTFMRALTDHVAWQGHFWNAWVNNNNEVRIVHNHFNTAATTTNNNGVQ